MLKPHPRIPQAIWLVYVFFIFLCLHLRFALCLFFVWQNAIGQFKQFRFYLKSIACVVFDCIGYCPKGIGIILANLLFRVLASTLTFILVWIPAVVFVLWH